MGKPGSDDDFDVAIIGYGPTGATLAALLGRLGHRVGVFDKAVDIYDQPRAVGFDHDAMRIFQRIGIARDLAPHIAAFRDAEYFGADGQVIQKSRHMPPPYPFTWSPNYSCDQPGMEAVLRRAVAAMPGVEVALGHECTGIAAAGDGARLEVRAPDGTTRSCRAAWAVGCDGASSPLRRMLGIGLDSMEYDESWIVVDVKVGDAALSRLPKTNVQYCEPERPSTHVICPGNHRRWEFMMLAGEPREGAVSEERLWRLLSRWLAPGEATIWRRAAYRFHALVARTWRSGPFLLAGDAAHQTPPFLGQGMCQGLRDAGNLAWKLDLVLGGRAAPDLLDSYGAERIPHVAETTRIARELGRLISERDPVRARERDARLIERGGGQAPTLIRQEMIPGLTAGLIAQDAPLAGRAFPQPVVDYAGGDACMLDDLTGAKFRLVVDAACDAPALRRSAAALGIPCVVVADRLRAPDGEEETIEVVERGTLVRDFLGAARCQGALVRPDHYVYGGFADAGEAEHLLADLARRVFPARSFPPDQASPRISRVGA